MLALALCLCMHALCVMHRGRACKHRQACTLTHTHTHSTQRSKIGVTDRQHFILQHRVITHQHLYISKGQWSPGRARLIAVDILTHNSDDK